MWSSERQKSSSPRNRVLSSSSSSSRSYYSSYSSGSSVFPETPRSRSMEEVWKNINNIPPPPIIPLPHHNSATAASHSFRRMILQDFLAGPSRETPAASRGQPMAPAREELPLPPTALSLNSGLGFATHNPNCSDPNQESSNNDEEEEEDENNHHRSASFISPSFSDAIMNNASSPAVGLFSFCANNKRPLESQADCFGGDRRHKRMMKNRESAARSRARKQAYTYELELEVAHLAAENRKLKQQNEELRLAMAAQHSTKKALQRTVTAPF